MAESVSRVDPSEIPTGLKEAVVDSLINQTFFAISGHGPEGSELFGARPRSILNSAFLLPRPAELGDGDEVTQPIQIYSHGLNFHVKSGHAVKFTVKPSFQVYVRVLPTSEDLRRSNMQLSFRVNDETRKALQDQTKAALEASWRKLKTEEGEQSRNKHPKWKETEKRVREEIHRVMGLPINLQSVKNPDALLDYTTTATSTSSVSELIDRELTAEVEGATVSSEAVAVELKDDHAQPLDIPQKWFRIPLDVGKLPALVVDASWSPERLKRELDVCSAELNGAVHFAIAEWAQSTQGKDWGIRKGRKVFPSQYKGWDAFLVDMRKEPKIELPAFKLEWDVTLIPNWLNPDETTVQVLLENRSQDSSDDFTETSVFQVSLETLISNEQLKELKLGRVKPSYRYNRYLAYPATGFNGGVKVIQKTEREMVLRTTWSPRYTQPRIIPKEHAGIDRNILALSRPEGLDGVLPLGIAIDRWFSSLSDSVQLDAGLEATDINGREREKNGFEKDCVAWEKEIAAIKAGLKILQESRTAWEKNSTRGPQVDEAAIVFEAWLCMNEAMADLLREKLKNDKGEWRLFQLAFIVAHIPAMATRLKSFHQHYDKFRDDTVTLLYFATGGGKSEAFFGLLAFTLFFDRLRGKAFGVTAMMRYPLRLLTIQQAQRCAVVLAKAELVRKRRGVVGAPFSIGFWVGSGGSPNHPKAPGFDDIPLLKDSLPTEKNERKLLNADSSRYRLQFDAWNKIPACPFCGQPTALRVFGELDSLLGHVCTNLQCASNEGGWSPLPFYICDTDIYAIAPSVVLGTVDKLALIGQSTSTLRNIYGMFGAAPWRHRETGRLKMPKSPKEFDGDPESLGYELLSPSYPRGASGFFDPFPSLLIQDEAHLLDESLGTFAGIFESSLDAIFEELGKVLRGLVIREPDGIKRRRAKVIAASATVSDPERQMEHLYQREVPAMQFPYPGESLYESFYANPAASKDGPVRDVLRDVNTEAWASWSRVYAAFLTNGRPHTATTVAVLASFHALVSRLMLGLTSTDEAEVSKARALLKDGISDGPLHSIYLQHIETATPDALATLVDLHRISLTYVTNKKGGDQIMAAEFEETRKKHEDLGLDISDLQTRLITGSVAQGEIQATVREAQRRPDPGQPFGPLTSELRSVIATSAISHGVDVEEFNSMFFAGMPSDVAEYIQASSRVGRTHVGFVVLLPTPQRRRDRYVIQVFDSYHRFLERMVAPAAIDRWADKAIERVLPSLLQTYLAGIRFVKEVTLEPPESKKSVRDLSWIPNTNSLFEKQGAVLVDGACSFIYKALGLDNDTFAPYHKEHYLEDIRQRVVQQLSDWASDRSMAEQSIGEFYKERPSSLQRPMTSLRDVDEAGSIRFAYRDFNGKGLDSDDARTIMRFTRFGSANDDVLGEQ
ncbi:helicase-related protein [Achromobacter sp. KK8]